MFWENGLPYWARRRADCSGQEPNLQLGYSLIDEVKIQRAEAEALKDDLNAVECRMDKLEADTI